MKNFYVNRKELGRYFFTNLYLDEWVRLTNNRHFDEIPDKIRKLQNHFIELLQLPECFIKDKKVHIRRMKLICWLIGQYYNSIRLKNYFHRKFKRL